LGSPIALNELTASIAFLTRLPLSRADADHGGRAARGAGRSRSPASSSASSVRSPMRWPTGSGCRHGRPRRLPSPRRSPATGCLHEDGLADTADGFGGGKTREQKLDIMRDSRIGTYGVCALDAVDPVAGERVGEPRRIRSGGWRP
jgi:adenosylcobinamide-GDP ribazoletransferase